MGVEWGIDIGLCLFFYEDLERLRRMSFGFEDVSFLF